MKIVGRILISLAGALALTAGAVAGCSTTNNLNNGGGTSDIGETCTRTFDCKTGLICEQNVCLKAAPTAPDGGPLPTGDSGAPPGPHLGLLNESCQTSADCQSPFECLGNECTIVNFGLTASTKSCVECTKAADCCEIPVGATIGSVLGLGFLEGWEGESPDGGFVFHPELLTANARCQDLLSFMGGDATICAGSANFTVNEEGLASACFLYGAYCGSCATNPPWACNSGQCAYTAPCMAGNETIPSLVSACPSATRLGHSLSTTCTSADGGAGSCTAGCVADADCAGKFPVGTNHACSAADAGGGGDCACNAADHACYFTCASDLDCAAGKSCDPAVHLCKTQPCATDGDCVQSLGNARAKCVTSAMMSACTLSCTKDTDCPGAPTNICSAGSCMPAGCTSDVDCTGTGAHSFCVTTPPSTSVYTSAVTN